MEPVRKAGEVNLNPPNAYNSGGFDTEKYTNNTTTTGTTTSGSTSSGDRSVSINHPVDETRINRTFHNNSYGSATQKAKDFMQRFATMGYKGEQSAQTQQGVDGSLNAEGGTLTNTGDLSAGRDITLDNSVTNQNTLNQFGGDVRQFTYNAPGYKGKDGEGGSNDGLYYPSMNSYKDPALNATPVSAATMAGFYGPSDSPAAAAKRTTMHSELNRSKQQSYQDVGASTANKYIKSAEKTSHIDTRGLSANLAVQPYVDEARSNQITADTFGDIWKFKPEQYYMPNPFEKPEQPDFDKMFDKISDKITDD